MRRRSQPLDVSGTIREVSKTSQVMRKTTNMILEKLRSPILEDRPLFFIWEALRQRQHAADEIERLLAEIATLNDTITELRCEQIERSVHGPKSAAVCEHGIHITRMMCPSCMEKDK